MENLKYIFTVKSPQKILVKGISDYTNKIGREGINLIKKYTDGLEYPFEAFVKNEKADFGQMIFSLPNGESLCEKWLDWEYIMEDSEEEATVLTLEFSPSNFPYLHF